MTEYMSFIFYQIVKGTINHHLMTSSHFKLNDNTTLKKGLFFTGSMGQYQQPNQVASSPGTPRWHINTCSHDRIGCVSQLSLKNPTKWPSADYWCACFCPKTDSMRLKWGHMQSTTCARSLALCSSIDINQRAHVTGVKEGAVCCVMECGCYGGRSVTGSREAFPWRAAQSFM